MKAGDAKPPGKLTGHHATGRVVRAFNDVSSDSGLRTPDCRKGGRVAEGNLMKLKLLFPCFITVMLSCTAWCAAAGGTARQTGVFLPSIDIQSSQEDLDVRDSNNNIIASIQAQQDLRDIFLSGLFSLLSQPELYTYARACEVLAKRLGFGAHALAAAAAGAVTRSVDALLSGRTEKNIVACFLVVFLAIVVVSAFRIPAPMLSLPLVAMAPVSLRC